MNKTRWINGALSAILWFVLPGTLAAQNVENLSLKQAVDKALQNSPEIALAQVRYNVAKNTVEANRAAFRPSMFTGSGAAYTYGFPQTLGGAAPSIVNFSYLQTLFNPGLSAQTRASIDHSETVRLELEKARNKVMLETSSEYLELAKVRHSLELMRNDRQSNTRILDFTRQRVNEGAELPIEVTRAELAQARTEQKIIQLESSERTLERQLAESMGLPEGSHIEVQSESLPVDENQGESDLTRRAVAVSVDLQEAEFERRASADRLEGEIGKKWPTVDLFSQYGLFGRFNNYQEYFEHFQRNNFNAGVEVRIPLLTGQRSADVAVARSQLTVAEAELRSKRENIELEVSRQYQHLRELDAAREVARLELKLAQENLQIVQAKFEEGKSNLRDVETSRLDENDKWLAFLDSEYDRQKAQLDLLNITGDLDRLLR